MLGLLLGWRGKWLPQNADVTMGQSSSYSWEWFGKIMQKFLIDMSWAFFSGFLYMVILSASWHLYRNGRENLPLFVCQRT